jgi:poly-D-alanine transfer protein DltD
LDSNNPIKEIWNVVKNNANHKSKNNCNITQLYKDPTKSDITNNPLEISNILNQLYINEPNLIHESTKTLDRTYKPKFIQEPAYHDKCLYLYPVTKSEINKYFQNLSESAACDVDGLSSKNIKIFSDVILEPITKIINQCFQRGIFPCDVK